MSFFVTQRALERLEWNRVLARLGEHTRTPGGRARCVRDARGPARPHFAIRSQPLWGRGPAVGDERSACDSRRG